METDVDLGSSLDIVNDGRVEMAKHVLSGKNKKKEKKKKKETKKKRKERKEILKKEHSWKN